MVGLEGPGIKEYPHDEVRKMDRLAMDILADASPRELSLTTVARLAGAGRTYMEKVLLTLREKGMVKMRKDEKESYWSIKT